MQNKFIVSSSPHLHTPDSTGGIMFDVIIALLPATIYGMIIFGYRAALIVAVSVASALLSEFVWNKLTKKENRRVTAEYFVDPTLLGGLSIEVDGKIMDGSVRRRLRDVKEVINK